MLPCSVGNSADSADTAVRGSAKVLTFRAAKLHTDTEIKTV
jgi:hypothetical protein